MSTAAADPRWGSEGRERKAAAIWLSLRQLCGEGIAQGQWLDVGCGSGGIAAALAPRVAGITGIDPEPWRQWEELQRGRPNLSYRSASFDQAALPLPAASVDVVICNQVYEHVGDPQQLLRNIGQVLRPGGYCYFAGPNLLWPVEPHVFWPFVHWLPRGFAQRLMRRLGSARADELDAYSAHFWKLQRCFAAAGLVARGAFSARVAAELELRGLMPAARLLRSPAGRLLDWGQPLAPGFVFLLRRP